MIARRLVGRRRRSQLTLELPSVSLPTLEEEEGEEPRTNQGEAGRFRDQRAHRSARFQADIIETIRIVSAWIVVDERERRRCA
jgi:hypothetical protein